MNRSIFTGAGFAVAFTIAIVVSYRAETQAQTPAAGQAASTAAAHQNRKGGGHKKGPPASPLPEQQIEEAINAQGEEENGVLHIELERTDIGSVVGPNGVAFTAGFELHGDIYFQPLPANQALLNGDMALRESEVNPFISALLANGLVFQAFHQHLPMNPQVWFVHYRGVGDPVALARELKAALNTTSTPFPQAPPQNPTTPLDANRLATILHGTATVGDEGVVSVSVDRSDHVTIGRVQVEPETGISTTIEFRPTGGSNADVVPDFSMTSEDINPVVALMLNNNGWYQGCLYNQETDEQPQLFFDHMLKSGDAYQLAQEIRNGLDLTDTQ